jgi:hypothetical protein
MTRIANRRAVLAAALSVAAAPAAGVAQGGVAVPAPRSGIARADALLRVGRVDAAEALYYREVYRRPRDPAARLALGRYLASRGATRIGVTLIEEARFFGANPTVAALHLAPLYARLGDYKALALLPAAPLTAAERARAEWLMKNASALVGPDSVAVSFTPVQTDTGSVVGSVTIVVDGEAIVADIDPAARGLAMDTSRAHAPSVRVFAGAPAAVKAGSPAVPVVVLRARLGGLTFTNLAASLEPLRSPTRARIGVDLLSRFSQTFDPLNQRILLRRPKRDDRPIPGERVPLVLDARDTWVVWQGRPAPITSESVTRRLRGGRWTLDSRRGEIVLQQ